MAIEGFIGKPPLEGAQIVELPTFKDPDPIKLLVLENPQPVIEEITSLDEGEETIRRHRLGGRH